MYLIMKIKIIFFGEFGFGKKVHVDTYIIIKYNSLFYNKKFKWLLWNMCRKEKYSYKRIWKNEKKMIH